MKIASKLKIPQPTPAQITERMRFSAVVNARIRGWIAAKSDGRKVK